jgi:hypothetical protein
MTPFTPSIGLIEEPKLQFRDGQLVEDPRAGLAVFGPYDSGFASQPISLPYGLIGTAQGVNAFLAWARLIQEPITPLRPRTKYRSKNARDIGPKELQSLFRLWPPFPGFEATFHAKWPTRPSFTHVLDGREIEALLAHRDPSTRAYQVVDLYLEGLAAAYQRDEGYSVFVCVVPDLVWQTCRPMSRVAEGKGEEASEDYKIQRLLHEDLFGDDQSERFQMAVDFRRQLKARAMDWRVPLQIIRESTLSPDQSTTALHRGLTPQSDRAWNLSTALYYKAGGKPWRLGSAREGVCYIGLAFRRSDNPLHKTTACCAAQMFLDSGDGVVFRGEFGPWYSPDNRQFHLNRASARDLLSGVLSEYAKLGGQTLKEIFLHARSGLDEQEFLGFQDACPKEAKLVGIRVRTEHSGTKMFRNGRWPVLRGTLMPTSENTAYLWGTGFKPSLLTYDGWDVPRPLRIDIQYGSADLNVVAKDIMGLTKLNYNACKLGDSVPVTIGFSDAVGEILVSNPNTKTPSRAFKFYI